MKNIEELKREVLLENTEELRKAVAHIQESTGSVAASGRFKFRFEIPDTLVWRQAVRNLAGGEFNLEILDAQSSAGASGGHLICLGSWEDLAFSKYVNAAATSFESKNREALQEFHSLVKECMLNNRNQLNLSRETHATIYTLFERTPSETTSAGVDYLTLCGFTVRYSALEAGGGDPAGASDRNVTLKDAVQVSWKIDS